MPFIKTPFNTNNFTEIVRKCEGGNGGATYSGSRFSGAGARSAAQRASSAARNNPANQGASGRARAAAWNRRGGSRGRR